MELDSMTYKSALSRRSGTSHSPEPKAEKDVHVDERDITDYHLPHWQWSRSTDELLVPCVPSSPRTSLYSVVTAIPDDDIRPGSETPRGQFPRMPVPAIHVQLADRQSDGPEVKEGTIYNLSPYPKQSGPRLEMSDHDLELQDVMIPCSPSRTQSTDQLVSNANREQLANSSTTDPKFVDEQPLAEDRTCFGDRTIPDWKPASIRWPFQVLLLVIMAGLVAFFEYQAHDLPPVQYTMIQLKPPAEGVLEEGAVNTTTTLSHPHVPLPTQPRPGVRGASLPIATSTSDSPSFGNPKILVAAPAPTPEPDPRPPEDAYPRPPVLFSTRCGYKKPEWRIYKEQFVRNPQMILQQTIPTFFTDDETWCPCYVELKAWTNATELTWSGDWGDRIYVKRTRSAGTEFSVTGAVAQDRECQTIMSLVSIHNNNFINDFIDGRAGSCYHPNGDGHVMTITPASVLLPGGAAITPSLFSTNTMTLSEQPSGVADWEWPKTDSQGNIQFLIDVRDVSSSLFRSRGPNECIFKTLDAFGNAFNVPPYTGFFFASHAATTRSNTLRRDWWTLPFASTSTAPTTTTSKGPEKVESSTIQSMDSATMSTDDPSIVISRSSTSSSITSQNLSESSNTVVFPTHVISSSLNTITPDSVIGTATDSATQANPSSGKSISKDPMVIVSPTATTGEPSAVASTTTSITRVGIVVSTRPATPTPVTTKMTNTALRPSGVSVKPEEEQPTTTETLVNGTSLSDKAKVDDQINSTSGEDMGVFAVSGPTTANSNATKSPTTLMTIPQSPKFTAIFGPTSEGEAHDPVVSGTQTSIKPELPSLSHSHTIVHPALTNATTTTTANTPRLSEIPKGPIPPGAGSSFANLRSETDFFMASLAPVILATILSIAMQIFTSSVSSMLPFRTLGYGSSDGARAEDSVTLSRNTGLWGLTGFRLLSHHRDGLCLINVLLGLLAAALVPVSSEVIRLEFSQYCGTYTERKNFADVPEVLPGHNMVCAYGLRKSGPTMRLAEGIVGVMAMMLCGMGYMIFRWRTGVVTEPWSIASMAALLVSSDKRIKDALNSIDQNSLLATSRGNENREGYGAAIKQAFQGKRFRMGWFSPPPETSRQTTTDTTTLKYGIYMVNEPASQDRSSIRLTCRNPPPPPKSKTEHQASWGSTSQTTWWRHLIVPRRYREAVMLSTALFLTTALLVLILYYENTISPDTKFEMFMNSQTFGVRILFTSLGTAATWFWDYYFSYTSSQAIYTRLFRDTQHQFAGEPARSSILLSPPTNIFLGIYQCFVLLITGSNTSTSRCHRRRRLGMILRGLSIALVALFAKFTPILFANIPFRDTVTFKMHEVCTWLAVFVLGCMVLVLCVSIWVNLMTNKITLPVMPDTIVGGMYYIAGSRMLRDFEGMDLHGVKGRAARRANKWARDKMVSSMSRRYGFSEREPGSFHSEQGDKHYKGETIIRRGLRVDYINRF